MLISKMRVCLSPSLSASFNINDSHDLSIPVCGASPPQCFGLPLSHQEPIVKVEDGSSVNVSWLHIDTHNATTHVESICHVHSDAQLSSIYGITSGISHFSLKDSLFGCLIITCKPQLYQTILNNESYFYHPNKQCASVNDLLITKSSIINAINDIESIIDTLFDKQENTSTSSINDKIPRFFKQSIVIRTYLTSTNELKHKQWTNSNPPYLSKEAICYLNDNFENILCLDLPSVDKEVSPMIDNHKIWFQCVGYNDNNRDCHLGTAPKTRKTRKARKIKAPRRLLVESCIVPENVQDGLYLLNLQSINVANTDAVPCRPVVYPCTKLISDKIKQPVTIASKL